MQALMDYAELNDSDLLLELEQPVARMTGGDLLDVELPGSSFDYGFRGYEEGTSWGWAGSPGWALN